MPSISGDWNRSEHIRASEPAPVFAFLHFWENYQKDMENAKKN
jgi:hypothetical protein